ncbi:ribbon-helix-helix domain-containing protein [Neorhizobium sp. IRAMC:178]|uniref:ribbon-helix-helix domain-containing protein n=1 Tax=Neorhizobium tunisiense TaxID=3144793 RepID=UPI0031F684C3
MDDNYRITVDISPELAAAVSEAVDSGEYASADEVIAHALREWAERQTESSSLFPKVAMTPEEHDAWFSKEVRDTLDRVSSGATRLMSHEEHLSRWRTRRAELLARAGGGK